MFSVCDTVKLILETCVRVVVFPLSADSVHPTPEHAGYDRSRAFKDTVTSSLELLGTANLACRVGRKSSNLDVHSDFRLMFAGLFSVAQRAMC